MHWFLCEAVAWWGQNSSQACEIINTLLLSLYMSRPGELRLQIRGEVCHAFCFYLERLKWQHVWASPFVSPKYYYCVCLVCCSFIMFMSYVRTVCVYGTERSLDHSLFRCNICLFCLTLKIFLVSNSVKWDNIGWHGIYPCQRIPNMLVDYQILPEFHLINLWLIHQGAVKEQAWGKIQTTPFLQGGVGQGCPQLRWW